MARDVGVVDAERFALVRFVETLSGCGGARCECLLQLLVEEPPHPPLPVPVLRGPLQEAEIMHERVLVVPHVKVWSHHTRWHKWVRGWKGDLQPEVTDAGLLIRGDDFDNGQAAVLTVAGHTVASLPE